MPPVALSEVAVHLRPEDNVAVATRNLRPGTELHIDGRAVTLESQAEKYPGRIDVYHTNPANRWPEYDRTRATTLMRRLAGCDYGYAAVLAAAMLHLPFIRMAVRAAIEDDAIDRRPPFCSQACAMTDRIGGGVDPVPHLADRLTEPADLARSPFYEYAFTLVP